jgi:hypothetical protein
LTTTDRRSMTPDKLGIRQERFGNSTGFIFEV